MHSVEINTVQAFDLHSLSLHSNFIIIFLFKEEFIEKIANWSADSDVILILICVSSMTDLESIRDYDYSDKIRTEKQVIHSK